MSQQLRAVAGMPPSETHFPTLGRRACSADVHEAGLPTKQDSREAGGRPGPWNSESQGWSLWPWTTVTVTSALPVGSLPPSHLTSPEQLWDHTARAVQLSPPPERAMVPSPGERTEAQRSWEARQGQEPMVNANLAPPWAKRLPSVHNAGPGGSVMHKNGTETGDRFPHMGTVFSSDHSIAGGSFLLL